MTQPATLPLKYEDRGRLSRANVGDIRYIDPWNVRVDKNRHMYVSVEAVTSNVPTQMCSLKIMRGLKGWEVWLGEGNEWKVEDTTFDSTRYEPIVALHDRCESSGT